MSVGEHFLFVFWGHESLAVEIDGREDLNQPSRIRNFDDAF